MINQGSVIGAANAAMDAVTACSRELGYVNAGPLVGCDRKTLAAWVEQRAPDKATIMAFAAACRWLWVERRDRSDLDRFVALVTGEETPADAERLDRDVGELLQRFGHAIAEAGKVLADHGVDTREAAHLLETLRPARAVIDQTIRDAEAKVRAARERGRA